VFISYNIYANDGAGGPVDYTTVVANTAGLTWTSGALGLSSRNRFAVRATDGVNEEENVDAHVDVIVNAAGADVTFVPFAPRGLVARNIAAIGAACRVRLDWSCPSYDRDHMPTGFRVYRGTTAPNYGVVIATVTYSAGKQHYSATMTGLTDATAYGFGVRAYNATGQEANDIVVTITADATPPDEADDLAATPTADTGD
jgi:hypothetical protein